jgi:hypothetical protein
MKILFFGDECKEFWGLLPVMNLLRRRHTVAFAAADQNALSHAVRHHIPIINTTGIFYDALVVNKMHYRVSRDLSETYFKAGKPVILVEHAWDGSIHLLDNLFHF